jgi:hypothetical protein
MADAILVLAGISVLFLTEAIVSVLDGISVLFVAVVAVAVSDLATNHTQSTDIRFFMLTDIHKYGGSLLQERPN